jgi:pimeloyl-ACP methyl ester carboxylesterase
MSSFILVKNRKIFFTDHGKGKIIVLLHGYLESLEIWSDFSVELSKKFRVISFDIPGHGNSECISHKHSMDELAATINSALKMLSIDKCFMIGHSMGGYITLMFQTLYPEMLSGFSLFHSHPFADTKETINKRLREIKLVEEGHKNLIATFNIPNAFATENIQQFKNEIDTAKKIAVKTTDRGIIANLNAMMNRPDLTESLEKTLLPFLYIAGKNDNYIDFKTVVPKIKMPVNSETKVLEKSGHMGFVEEKINSVKIVESFINKYILS